MKNGSSNFLILTNTWEKNKKWERSLAFQVCLPVANYQVDEYGNLCLNSRLSKNVPDTTFRTF